MTSLSSGRALKHHAELERSLALSVRNGLFKGAICLIEQVGRPAQVAISGFASKPAKQLVTPASLFELGALSQSVGLAAYVAWLVGHNRLDLDAKLRVCLPGLASSGFAHVPIGALLEHQAGLPSLPELWEKMSAQAKGLTTPVRLGGGPAAPRLQAAHPKQPLASFVLPALCDIRPEYPPLTAARYTQLAPFLVGLAIEALGKKTLLAQMEAALWRPLGITQTLMASTPSHAFTPSQKSLLVAPGVCRVRGQLAAGEALCPVAAASGGLAGHSGLKGSAGGVMTLLHALRRAYLGDKNTSLLQSSAVRTMWTRSPRLVDAPWAVGWQSLGRGGPLGQGRWHPSSVGQINFEEGNAYFIDPHHNVCCVLLTHGFQAHPAARAGLSPEKVSAAAESTESSFKLLANYAFERALSLR